MKKFFSILLLLCGFLTLSATLVSVKARTVEPDSVTFANSNYSNQQAIEEVSLTNSKLNFSKGSNNNAPKYFTSGTAIRMYGGNTMTVTALNSTTITEITLSYGSSDGSNAISTDVGTFTSPTWTGSASSIVFTIGGTSGNRRVASITIKYADLPDDIVTFVVSFDTSDGSSVQSQTVLKDAKVERPADPTKSGYIFAGWFKDAELTQIFDFDVETITTDTTVYAKWDVDPYTHVVINKTNFLSNSGGNSNSYNDFTNPHTIGGIVIESTSVSNNSGSNLQFRCNNSGTGTMNNSTPISGNLASIKMDFLQGSLKVSSSPNKLSASSADAVTLDATNNTYVPTNATDKWFFIEAAAATNLNYIDIAYTYVESTTYSISFDAGKGAFKADKGVTITENVGTPTSVTLPVADDLAKTAYLHSVLIGWSDGTTIYELGQEIQVSENKSFAAVYAAPENVTVAQANEIADETGSADTLFKFSTVAKVVSINGRNIHISDDSTTETFVAYLTQANANKLKVGDVVKFEGKIKTYNGTKEYDSPSVTVVKLAEATAFEAEETKSSLKLDNDTVSIRFGNRIAANSFYASASYGVVASLNAEDLADLTVEKINALKTSGHVAECTPVKVNASGVEDANGEFYQFALVLTNVPATDYEVEVHAVMYMIFNDTVYVAQVKSASVKSVANAYLADVTGFGLTSSDVAALQAIVA